MTPAEFKAIRTALGLTQSEWGLWLGRSRDAVIKMEGGRAIDDTVSRLAAAYAQGYRPSSEPGEV